MGQGAVERKVRMSMFSPLIQSLALWDSNADGVPQLRAHWSASTKAAALLAPINATRPLAPEVWRDIQITDRSDGHQRATVSIPVRPPVGSDFALLTLGLSCAAGQPAALESWVCPQPQGNALSLRRGWYSEAATPMAQLSQHTWLPYGVGLPGLAWELAAPAYFGQIGTSQMLAHATSPLLADLHHGLAFPAATGHSVLALLSCAAQPIARRVELSVSEHGVLRRVGGYCQRDGDLFPKTVEKPWGASLLAGLTATRGPAIAFRDADLSRPSPFDALDAQVLLSWPFLGEGGTITVMALWL